MNWQPIETFKGNLQDVPNELVMLLVEVTPETTNCLIDAVEGTRYVTMGNWYPAQAKQDIPGWWEVVGWDWDSDCFVGTNTEKVIAWAPMPNANEIVL